MSYETFTVEGDQTEEKIPHLNPDITQNSNWQYKCSFDLCETEFQTQTDAYEHIEEHFSTINDSFDDRYRCDICQKRYSKLLVLVAHLRTHVIKLGSKSDTDDALKNWNEHFSDDDNVEVSVSKKCSKKSKCQGIEPKMDQNSSDASVVEDADWVWCFTCTSCQKSFSNRQMLKTHLQTHVTKKDPNLQDCSKPDENGIAIATETEEDLKQEEKTADGSTLRRSNRKRSRKSLYSSGEWLEYDVEPTGKSFKTILESDLKHSREVLKQDADFSEDFDSSDEESDSFVDSDSSFNISESELKEISRSQPSKRSKIPLEVAEPLSLPNGVTEDDLGQDVISVKEGKLSKIFAAYQCCQCQFRFNRLDTLIMHVAVKHGQEIATNKDKNVMSPEKEIATACSDNEIVTNTKIKTNGEKTNETEIALPSEKEILTSSNDNKSATKPKIETKDKTTTTNEKDMTASVDEIATDTDCNGDNTATNDKQTSRNKTEIVTTQKEIATNENIESYEEDTTTKKWSCLVCQEEFCNLNEIIFHFYSSHCKEVPVDQDYKGEVFMSSLEPVDKLTCDKCNQVFLRYERYLHHIHVPCKQKKWCCRLCEEVRSLWHSLQRHLPMHTAEPQFKCEFSKCGRAFHTTARRNKHQQKTHDVEGNKLHRCHCLRVFRSKAEFNKHMATHDVVEYKCKQCEKKFENKQSLIRHERKHTQKNYKFCDKCGKGFVNSNSLERHMLKHSGIKPFQCEHCPKAFSQRPNLKTHLRQHTGEKPFICDVCAEGFTNKCTLKIHIEKKHPRNRH